MNAPNNCSRSLSAAYKKHEDKKKRIYGLCVHEIEQGVFTPLVLSNNWRHVKGSSDILWTFYRYAIQQTWHALQFHDRMAIQTIFCHPEIYSSLHQRKQIFSASSHQRHSWHSHCLFCAPAGIGPLQNFGKYIPVNLLFTFSFYCTTLSCPHPYAHV